MKDVEKALLEEDFDYGFDDLYESPEATPALHEARLGVQNAMLGFRHGTTTAKDLAQAAQRFADELARHIRTSQPDVRIVCSNNRCVLDRWEGFRGMDEAAYYHSLLDLYDEVVVRTEALL
jgi:hypothetical protein